jgi:hypothetical protein
MKIVCLIAILLVVFSCNNPKQKVSQAAEVRQADTINKKPIVKVEEPAMENIASEAVFESDSVNFDFFIGKINYEGLKQLERILLDYRAIKNDSQMFQFYKYDLGKAKEIMDTSFYNYVTRNDLDAESEIYDWGGIVRETFPFLIAEYGGEFDGAGVFENYELIYTECLATKGESDEQFFEIYMDCFGPQNSTYDHVNFSYVDGRGFSSMGEKRVLSVIRKIAKADSSLFYFDCQNIGNRILNIEDRFFAASKEEVFFELDALLDLKDSVQLKFDKIEALRGFLDTATSGVYYNCEIGNCPV